MRWYEGLPHDKGKTVRECYALAKAIMKSATAADGVLPGAVNPFSIDGAGTIATPLLSTPFDASAVTWQNGDCYPSSGSVAFTIDLGFGPIPITATFTAETPTTGVVETEPPLPPSRQPLLPPCPA